MWFYKILDTFGLPKRFGKLKEIGKFDNLFFGVVGRQAYALDPQIAILLEETYEAIVDAGKIVLVVYCMNLLYFT